MQKGKKHVYIKTCKVIQTHIKTQYRLCNTKRLYENKTDIKAQYNL